MASPKTIQTTVGFADPENNLIANGFLTLDLSNPATILGTGGQIAPTRVVSSLDANAKIIQTNPNNLLWANDQLAPSNTVYFARLYNSNNLLVSGPLNWSIIGGSPIDLSQEIAIGNLPLVSVPGVVLLNPVAGQTIIGQDLTVSGADMEARRFSADQGTLLVSGNFVLSAGWGSTATVTAVIGFDSAWEILVTSGGTGIASGPTVTFTFADGTWALSPIGISKMVGGTGQFADITDTMTATVWTMTYNGLPVSGSTYRIRGLVLGR